MSAEPWDVHELPRVDCYFLARRPRSEVATVIAILLLAFAGSLAVALPADAGEIVAAVNEANPVSEISLNQLRLLYAGRRSSWDDNSPVDLLLPPSQSEALDYLVRRVFRMSSEDELGQYYLTAIFQQKMSKAPPQLSTPAALQWVAARRGAIVLVDADDPAVARKGVRLVPVSLK